MTRGEGPARASPGASKPNPVPAAQEESGASGVGGPSGLGLGTHGGATGALSLPRQPAPPASPQASPSPG